jgi:hypothetical protein
MIRVIRGPHSRFHIEGRRVVNYETIRLAPRLQSLVDSELQHGERVTWVEQPIPRRVARKALPLLIFAIPWTAFAVFWMCAAAWMSFKAEAKSGFAYAFPLFGLPFVLIGAALLSTPLWLRRMARRTVYVLTDRRAMVLAAGWRGTVTVRSFAPERLKDLRRKEYRDGSGDLVFTQDLPRSGNSSPHAREVGFLSVPDVRSVEEMVRALAAKTAVEQSPPTGR